MSASASRSARNSLLADPSLRRMGAMVLQHRPLLALALCTMLIDSACQVWIAKLTARLLDHGIIPAVYWIPPVFVGVFVVRGLANFSSSYLVSNVSQSVLVQLRQSMFHRLLRWPQATLENTPSGLVISESHRRGEQRAEPGRRGAHDAGARVAHHPGPGRAAAV